MPLTVLSEPVNASISSRQRVGNEHLMSLNLGFAFFVVDFMTQTSHESDWKSCSIKSNDRNECR